jgi:hypothetical protein
MQLRVGTLILLEDFLNKKQKKINFIFEYFSFCQRMETVLPRTKFFSQLTFHEQPAVFCSK